MQNIPADPLKQLTNLEELDLSNNRIRNVPDTSFHFLKKLRTLELQDNIIESLQKGTFQVCKIFIMSDFPSWILSIFNRETSIRI